MGSEDRHNWCIDALSQSAVWRMKLNEKMMKMKLKLKMMKMKMKMKMKMMMKMMDKDATWLG